MSKTPMATKNNFAPVLIRSMLAKMLLMLVHRPGRAGYCS